MNSNDAPDHKLKELLEKEVLTDQEKQWLLLYLGQTPATELKDLLRKEFDQPGADIPNADPAAILARLNKQIDNRQQARVKRIHFYRWAGAAAVIMLVLAGALYLFIDTPQRPSPVARQQPTPVDKNPGTEKAILTLDDGSTISVAADVNGVIARQGEQVIASSNGTIQYDGTSASTALYNTMATGKGNQFSVKLSDGTRVWLNASSSIRYPTRFSGLERRVEVTGEVYFEVARDQLHPFIVKVSSDGQNSGEIKVLGTHFNVNAYGDEAFVKTTLAEGKVQVRASGNEQILSPSEQAVFSKQSNNLTKKRVDISKELAWHNGIFEFDDDDVSTIMRQISRWYNVAVQFQGPAPKQRFSGSIRRQATLNQVFQILRYSGISCSYNGQVVTVSAR